MTLKRSPLKRRTPLVAKTAPKRSTTINPVNRERSAEKRARNFGSEAERVRAMECACTKRLRDDWMQGKADKSMACAGKVEAAHVVARGGGGAKGDRWRLVPLCTRHHREAGEAPRPGTVGDAGTQRQVFERRYGLDLIDEADRIALEHPRPLGIRGLADRWAANVRGEAGDLDDCPDCNGEAVPATVLADHDEVCEGFRHDILDGGGGQCLGCGEILASCPSCPGYRPGRQRPPEPLAGHDLDALLGWAHREMARRSRQMECENSGSLWSVDDGTVTCLAPGCGGRLVEADRDALARHISLVLGQAHKTEPSPSPFNEDWTKGEHSLAWTLCEAAAERFGGWPA